MGKTKVGKYETEQAVIKAMQEIAVPVTSAYIEKTVGLDYRTVVKNFDEMRRRGLVKKIDTTGNSVYVLSDWLPVDTEMSEERSRDEEKNEANNFSKTSS